MPTQPLKAPLTCKTTPILDDYRIGTNVLGLGINGKVVECFSKKDGKKYALKVIKDGAKARREADLHWRASSCPQIVHVNGVYENKFGNNKCLLMVLECMEGGELFARIQERGEQAFTERGNIKTGF